MSWIAVGVGVGTAGASYLSSKSAAKSGEKAADAQLDLSREVRDENLQIGKDALDAQLGVNRRTRQNQGGIARDGFQGGKRIANQTFQGQKNALREGYGTQRQDLRRGQSGAVDALRDASRGARNDLRPYAQQGTRSTDVINYELGMGSKPKGYRGFEGTQGYQFQLGEALDAAQGSAAARGSLMSGATMEALQNRAAGLAQQDYGNFYDRLSGQQMLGYDASGQIADIRMATGSGVADIRRGTAQDLATAAGNYSSNLANTYGQRGDRLGANMEQFTGRRFSAEGTRGANDFNAYGAYAGNASGANTTYGAAAADAYGNMGGVKMAGAIGAGNALTGGLETGLTAYEYLRNRRGTPGGSGGSGATGAA